MPARPARTRCQERGGTKGKDSAICSLSGALSQRATVEEGVDHECRRERTGGRQRDSKGGCDVEAWREGKSGDCGWEVRMPVSGEPEVLGAADGHVEYIADKHVEVAPAPPRYLSDTLNFLRLVSSSAILL
jgi:hypothetical protein